MLRIAIVGLGRAGMRHVEAIQELCRKITVDCLVDNDPEPPEREGNKTRHWKNVYRFSPCARYPDVDVVSICTPHNLHCPIALSAAADKKHTLCEKPIAITVADVTRMIDAAETNGVKLGSSKAFIR